MQNGFICNKQTKKKTHRSIITGSEGVSFRLPQLFLSQHRLKNNRKKMGYKVTDNIIDDPSSIFTPRKTLKSKETDSDSGKSRDITSNWREIIDFWLGLTCSSIMNFTTPTFSSKAMKMPKLQQASSPPSRMTVQSTIIEAPKLRWAPGNTLL